MEARQTRYLLPWIVALGYLIVCGILYSLEMQ